MPNAMSAAIGWLGRRVLGAYLNSLDQGVEIGFYSARTCQRIVPRGIVVVMRLV